MPFSVLLGVVAGLSVFAYRFGTGRARAVSPGRQADLHSRPMYHGLYVAIWCGIPALLVAVTWVALQPILVKGLVLGGLPDAYAALPESRLNLIWNDIRNLALGDVVRADPAPEIQARRKPSAGCTPSAAPPWRSCACWPRRWRRASR
jgi:phosphate transport system permease protein